MIITIVVHGRAIPWSAPDVVPMGRAMPGQRRRRSGVKDPKLKAFQEYLGMVARTKMHGKKPLSGAVELSVMIYFSIPPSWPKWKRTACEAGIIRPTSRPDLTNLVKAIEDALNGIVWGDDSQVTDQETSKRYVEPGGCERIEVEARDVGLGNDAKRYRNMRVQDGEVCD